MGTEHQAYNSLVNAYLCLKHALSIMHLGEHAFERSEVIFSRPVGGLSTFQRAHVPVKSPVTQSHPCFLPPVCNLLHITSFIANV